MVKKLSLLALGAAIAVIQAAPAPTPRKSPELAIQMVDGPQQLLSSYRGKVVVLALMYTTCPHCQKTAGVLAQVQKEYAARGVQILGATFDNGAAFRVQQFNKMLGLNFPCGYASQGSVLEYLGLQPNEPYFVPVLVFIDKQGTIRSQYIGDENFLNNQEVNIRAEIDKLLKAPAPVSRSTVSKGAGKS